MALRYAFRDAPVRIKNGKDADPNQIGRALQSITEANGGRLTTRAALDVARNRRNALHRHIEWNDKIAAEAHRRDQMSELIRIVIVDDDDGDAPPRRAFLSIADRDGVAYRTVQEVLSSRDLQLEVLRAALRDLEAWEQRYSELQEICQLVRVAGQHLKTRIKTREMEVRP